MGIHGWYNGNMGISWEYHANTMCYAWIYMDMIILGPPMMGASFPQSPIRNRIGVSCGSTGMGVPSLSLWIPIRVSSLYTVCISILVFSMEPRSHTHIYMYIHIGKLFNGIYSIYIYMYVNVYIMTYGYTMNSMTVCDTIWTCKLIMILYGYHP